jgi:flagellar biosynthesis component FlhA
LPPDAASHLVQQLGDIARRSAAQGHETVILTAPRSRSHVRSAIARSFPQARVLSYAELAPQVQVEVIAQLGLSAADA